MKFLKQTSGTLVRASIQREIKARGYALLERWRGRARVVPGGGIVEPEDAMWGVFERLTQYEPPGALNLSNLGIEKFQVPRFRAMWAARAADRRFNAIDFSSNRLPHLVMVSMLRELEQSGGTLLADNLASLDFSGEGNGSFEAHSHNAWEYLAVGISNAQRLSLPMGDEWEGAQVGFNCGVGIADIGKTGGDRLHADFTTCGLDAGQVKALICFLKRKHLHLAMVLDIDGNCAAPHLDTEPGIVALRAAGWDVNSND